MTLMEIAVNCCKLIVLLKILSAQCHCLFPMCEIVVFSIFYLSFFHLLIIYDLRIVKNAKPWLLLHYITRKKKNWSASLSFSEHTSSESSGLQFDFIADPSHNLLSCLPDMQDLFFYFLSPWGIISFTICVQPRLLAADYSLSLLLFPSRMKRTKCWSQMPGCSWYVSSPSAFCVIIVW